MKNKEELQKPFPQENDAYQCYNTKGVLDWCLTMDNNKKLNAFKTKEEAEKAKNIQLAKQRVANKIATLNKGWIPDWNDNWDFKFSFYYNYNKEKIEIDWVSTYKHQPNWFYCKTYLIANEVLKECKEDLLLIFSE